MGKQQKSNRHTNDGHDEKLLTLQEAAKFMRIHEMSLYRFCKEKKVPSFRVGGRWRFKQSKLDSWMKKMSNGVGVWI